MQEHAGYTVRLTGEMNENGISNVTVAATAQKAKATAAKCQKRSIDLPDAHNLEEIFNVSERALRPAGIIRARSVSCH
jgi:hypothetical protein